MKKIKMEIIGLSFSQLQSGAYALILGEADGNKRLPIIIGILAGLYSANFINGYVWAYLEEKNTTRRKGAKLKAKKA